MELTTSPDIVGLEFPNYAKNYACKIDQCEILGRNNSVKTFAFLRD